MGPRSHFFWTKFLISVLCVSNILPGYYTKVLKYGKGKTSTYKNTTSYGIQGIRGKENVIYDIFGIQGPDTTNLVEEYYTKEEVAEENAEDEEEAKFGYEYYDEEEYAGYDRHYGDKDQGDEEGEYTKGKYFNANPHAKELGYSPHGLGFHTNDKTNKRKKTKKSTIVKVVKNIGLSHGMSLGTTKSLKECMEKCEEVPTCAAGSYTPEFYSCHMHAGDVCDSLEPHHNGIFFQRVLCEEDVRAIAGQDISFARVFADLAFKTLFPVKSKNYADCVYKCLKFGNGVAINTSGTTTTISESDLLEKPQVCFGITYDLAQHQCFLYTRSHYFNVSDVEAKPICSTTSNSLDQEFDTSDVFDAKAGSVSAVICPRPDQ